VTEIDPAKHLVTPVMRGMRLLRYIAEGGSTANLSEVGRLIDVNRVTVMRLLETLEHEGLIERLPQGGHRVGMAFLTMAASVLGSIDLFGAGRRMVERLSGQLGVSAYMVVLDGHDVVYVHREMPEAGLVSHIRVGSRVSAFLTAPGRAMLALLPRVQLKRLWEDWNLNGADIRKGVVAVDLDEFVRRLEDDARQGHAWSFSGYEAGINACAAVVKDNNALPVAALSVVAPQPLFEADPDLRERMQHGVMLAAQELSRVAGG